MNFRIILMASSVSLLGACAGSSGISTGSTPVDPATPDVDRLSDVALATGTAAIAAPPEQAGFFSGLMSSLGNQGGATSASAAVNRTGPDAKVVPFGTTVPFGEIVTVCDAPRNGLGTRIAAVSGYEVYDSFPNSTAPRPHYIKGFADGCVRQYTAALSLMGDIGTHEVVRYRAQSSGEPYSPTDTAYEAIKSSFCRVSHGKPCGARVDDLAKNTTFLSVYERFGTNGAWFEILLHGGQVAAIAMEDN